jgi:hypothetical protein
VQLLLHAKQAGRLGFLQARDGDTRPAADDEGDLLLAEHRAMRLTPLLPFLLLLPDVAL